MMMLQQTNNGNGNLPELISNDVIFNKMTQPTLNIGQSDIYKSNIPSLLSFESYQNEYVATESNNETENVLRTHYSRKIIESLEWLYSNHISALDSIPYIQTLLETLKNYSDRYYADPFASFTSALYDALIFQDKWAEVKKEVFGSLVNIIIPLSNNKNLNYATVDKAINKIDKLGLDTTPF